LGSCRTADLSCDASTPEPLDRPKVAAAEQEAHMADKSPKKPNAKKAGKSLKEKRADKHAKRDTNNPGFSR